MKLHNVLLACAVGAGSLLYAAPASAAHISGGAVRPAATGRLLPGNRYYGSGYRYYGSGYRGYGYRSGYGYPYRSGYGYRYGYAYPYAYGVGIGVGSGYGYVGGGYGYAPYPAVYGYRAYWARRPYWRPYRRAYRRPRFIR